MSVPHLPFLPSLSVLLTWPIYVLLCMLHIYCSRFTLYYTDEEFRRLAVLPMLNSVVLKEFTRKVFTDAKTANNKKDDGDEQVYYITTPLSQLSSSIFTLSHITSATPLRRDLQRP